MNYSTLNDSNTEIVNPAKEEKKEEPAGLFSLCSTLGFRAVACLIIKNITIEPVAILAMASITMSNIPTQFLIYDKVCRLEQGYDEDMCNKILYNSSYHSYKEDLQSKSANWIMINMAAGLIPDILFKLLAGAWSDKHGRKPLILLVIYGTILKQIGLMFNIYYENAGVGWLVLATLPSKIFSSTVLPALCISYISDITEDTNRTRRIFLMLFGIAMGSVFGTVGGGFAQDSTAFNNVLIAGIVIAAIAILYCQFLIKETRGKPIESFKDFAKSFRDFFIVSHIKDTLQVLYVKRPNNVRLHLILLILASFFDKMLLYCHSAIDGLYTQSMFNFSDSKLSTISWEINLTNVALLIFAIRFMMIKYRLLDITIAVIAFTTAAIGYAVSAASIYPWIFYLGSVLGFMSVLPDVVIQSNLTKIVKPEEIGKVMTLAATVVSFGGSDTNLAFVAIYRASKDFFHGFTYLITSALYTIPLSFFIVMYKKPATNAEEENSRLENIRDN